MIINVVLCTQAMQAAGVTQQQLQMVLQQRLSLPRPMSTGQVPSRLPNATRQASSVAYGVRPSFAAAFTKSLSTTSNFKAPLPPLNAASLSKVDKRKYDTLRFVYYLAVFASFV